MKMTMKRILIVATGLFLLAGCAGNTTFVYKPSAPVLGVRPAPLKLAVLPFADGTEDFTSRGGIFDQENFFYNLAKAGYGGVITAIPPELWAKALADEMAASGSFRSVRFIYSRPELIDEDILIEGTVEKATIAGAFGYPNEFTLGLRATRRTNGRPVWEKLVSRKWVNQQLLYDGCGAMAIQCMVDRHHSDTNRVMQSIFDEARTDLVRTLASQSGKPAGKEDFPPVELPAMPKAPESVDETIEEILKGK